MKPVTITPYVPAVLSEFSPLNVAGCTIHRQPLRGTPHTLYVVMQNGQEIGRQISYPSPLDCTWYAGFARGESRARKPRAQPAPVVDVGTLTERIVTVLKLEKLGLGGIASTVQEPAQIISPILTRLTREGRIRRRGSPGAYTYIAA